MNNNDKNLNQQPPKPLPDWAYHTIMTIYVALNGMCTGNIIRSVRHLINDDTNTNKTVLSMLIYTAMCVYTASRAYAIYTRQKSAKNDKQR